jgi:hypothetical protein
MAVVPAGVFQSPKPGRIYTQIPKKDLEVRLGIEQGRFIVPGPETLSFEDDSGHIPGEFKLFPHKTKIFIQQNFGYPYFH